MRNSMPEDAGWFLDEYDADRFWPHVNQHGGLDHKLDPLSTATGECWIYVTAFGDKGYGRFVLQGRNEQAHRIAYLDFGMKLSRSQVIDHLCRNHRCVRPSHLEATTQKTNMERGIKAQRSECPSGHEWTEENTSWQTRKGKTIRVCRTCRATYAAGLRARHKAQAA